MGYFNRHHGQAVVHTDATVEELREWFVDDEPATSPYERALHDAPDLPGPNLVVVSDDAGVIATVLDTEHGAVWRGSFDRDSPSGPGREFVYELMEWPGDRPRPLRLVAGRRGEGTVVELDPDRVWREVEAARRTGKVQRILV